MAMRRVKKESGKVNFDARMALMCTDDVHGRLTRLSRFWVWNSSISADSNGPLTQSRSQPQMQNRVFFMRHVLEQCENDCQKRFIKIRVLGVSKL